MSMKRKPLPKKQSKKLFSRTAGSKNVNPKNLRGAPMRGGIRL